MAKASNAEVTEQATAWLAALDSGSADVAQFEQWRSSDGRHAAAFAEAAAAWEELDRLRPMRSRREETPPLVTRRSALQAAAAVGGIAIAGYAAFPFANEASAETGIGERRRLVLPDGSLVVLNTQSRVRWQRWAGTRRLWLDHGELAITVAPGAEPFLLQGETPTALSSGQFNARRDNGVMTVLPLAGRAVMQGQPITVGAIASVTGTVLTVANADQLARDRAMGWQRGDIIFDGETVAEAVSDYNRYLRRTIVITDPELARQRLGGRFRSTDPDPFLRALVDGFGARIVDNGRDPIVVSGPQKNPSAR